LLWTACAGLSRFSVGVEQVGDTLPESGQETDWGKAAPTCNLYLSSLGLQQRANALPAVESKTHTRPTPCFLFFDRLIEISQTVQSALCARRHEWPAIRNA
jgi:hypothetical protein